VFALPYRRPPQRRQEIELIMKKYFTFAVVLTMLTLGTIAAFSTRASTTRTVEVLGPSCDLLGTCSVREVMDLPSIPAFSTMDFKIVVPTAVVEEDSVVLTPNGILESGLVWTGYEFRTEEGVVYVVLRVGNVTASAIDPAPRKWRASIFKFAA
jgi:hypothetical protein